MAQGMASRDDIFQARPDHGDDFIYFGDLSCGVSGPVNATEIQIHQQRHEVAIFPVRRLVRCQVRDHHVFSMDQATRHRPLHNAARLNPRDLHDRVRTFNRLSQFQCQDHPNFEGHREARQRLSPGNTHRQHRASDNQSAASPHAEKSSPSLNLNAAIHVYHHDREHCTSSRRSSTKLTVMMRNENVHFLSLHVYVIAADIPRRRKVKKTLEIFASVMDNS